MFVYYTTHAAAVYMTRCGGLYATLRGLYATLRGL